MSIKTYIQNLWAKKFKRPTRLGDMYVVQTGPRLGQFLILVGFDPEKQIYSVLSMMRSMPDAEAIYISAKDLEFGKTHQILDFVRSMPKDIIQECQNEFKYREINK